MKCTFSNSAVHQLVLEGSDECSAGFCESFARNRFVEEMIDKLAIVIPAYNEEESIRSVVNKALLTVPQAVVIVIDDGSTDATFSRVIGCGNTKALRHCFNLGYGAAVQTGVRYAKENGFSIVVMLDADGQHEPEEIPRLLEHLERTSADVVIGSRFSDSNRYQMQAFRRVGTSLFRKIVELSTGLKITDPTSGFQAIGAGAISLYASTAYPVDFPDADVLIMLHRAGLKVAELPVTFHENLRGKSMHSGVAPLYYVFKMCLSIVMSLIRKKEVI